MTLYLTVNLVPEQPMPPGFEYAAGLASCTCPLGPEDAHLADCPLYDPSGLDYSRPADDPQPSGGREPMHTGAMTDGGLVDETEREVRCAIVSPHEPHRTTFAPIMGIENGRCPGVEFGTAECGCPVRLAPEIRGDAADTLVEHDDSICTERPF